MRTFLKFSRILWNCFFILRVYLSKAVLYMNYYWLLIIFSSTLGLAQCTDSFDDNLQFPYRCCQFICMKNDDYFPLRRWDHSIQTYIRGFILNIQTATQHALIGRCLVGIDSRIYLFCIFNIIFNWFKEIYKIYFVLLTQIWVFW